MGMNQKPTFVGPVTTERAVLGGKWVTDHRSEASLSRYFRDVDLFADNAAARVL